MSRYRNSIKEEVFSFLMGKKSKEGGRVNMKSEHCLEDEKQSTKHSQIKAFHGDKGVHTTAIRHDATWNMWKVNLILLKHKR